MESKPKRLIILTRHGERIDNTSNRKKQVLPSDDPELTDTGRKQALNMGQKIASYVKENYGIELDEKTAKVLSSPFSRTLQTSLNLIKSYGKYSEDNIRIENRVCELIFSYIVNDFPHKYVSIFKSIKSDDNSNKNNSEEKFDNYFEKFENRKINFENSKYITSDTLPKRYESEKDVYERLADATESNIKEFFLDNKSSVQVLNFVSHAGTMNYFYLHLLCLMHKDNPKMIKEIKDGIHDVECSVLYCDSFIFSVYINDDKTFNVIFDKKLTIHH